MQRILTIIAFLVFCGFLGVLVFKLPRIDLGLVVGITVLMARTETTVAQFRAFADATACGLISDNAA